MCQKKLSLLFLPCDCMQYNVRYCEGLSVCLSVCPSVRPTVKRVDCDKTKETSAHILIPHERTFILVFRHEEWFVGDDPLYLKFSAKLTTCERNRRFSIDIRS